MTSPTAGARTGTTGTNLAWLSWLRVVAISGVVTIHTVGLNATAPDARETLRGTIAIYLDLGLLFAVPVFVMLSGAVLLDPAKYAEPGPFLRKRALRLLPPLVFWHAWYVALTQLRRERDRTPGQLVTLILNGDLYTALYFFWIVLGLALVTPLLVPFVRGATRRQVLAAGAVLAALPALSQATTGLRENSAVTVDTPWTWWFPYLGVYFLGWGLRGVVVRGWWLALLVPVTAVLALVPGYQWRNPDAPAWLVQLSPANYYGFLTVVYSVAVVLLAQALVRPDGPLAVLARGRAAQLGRLLGDATLGVFGLHLTTLFLVQRHVYDDQLALDGTTQMLGRTLLVLVATYAVVLVLRRVRYVRAVL